MCSQELCIVFLKNLDMKAKNCSEDSSERHKAVHIMNASSNMQTALPEGYKPTDEEEFMNPVMTAFFKKKLLDWRNDIVEQTKETINYLKGENVSHPDPADTAAANADRQLELRTKDRLRKLLNKIDKALARIEDGTYGYCDETGDPIRVGRLSARPIATLSIEAQVMHERGEKMRAN